MRVWALWLLWLPSLASAMVLESGSLRGFLLDSCAACAYDNWLSHVSENFVRPDYNDYGPPNLDPVTNGFGSFTLIPETVAGDSTLARWRQLFDFALVNNWTQVDTLLARHNAEWNYELVRLHEPGMRDHYHVLRERLDSSFVDTNGDTLSSNDVIGGFRKGWGVFVFNPEARHEHAVVQVPHPEDDYMAPPVATELFLRGSFAVLMIAGAGREVLWDTTHANYDNAWSLSDPSRNRRHPFAIATEAAKDMWDTPPVSPFIVIQLHSYDHNEHVPLGDMQVSCFFDDYFPNPPIRDVAYHRDFVHGLPLFPIRAIDGDSSIVTRVDEYLSLWCSPRYRHMSEDTTVELRSIEDYLGALENQQGIYCHAEHDENYDTENFVHIEMDEYPDALWTPTDFLRWLPGTPPARLTNFRNVIDYYTPLITALDSALTWHEVPDVHAPDSVALLSVSRNNATSVWVSWNVPALDQHFDTYEIYYDTTTITESSPHKTRYTSPTYALLGDMNVTTCRVLGLAPPLERYRFAVRARDIADNASPFSREWGIVDTLIHDVTIRVDGDSLRLHWSAQYYDSLYEIWEYPPNAVGYYLIAVTDTNEHAVAPVSYPVNGVSILKVKRIARH